MLDLAPHPDDGERLVATGEKGLYASPDAGRGWRPLAKAVGLLAWPRADRLVLVDLAGTVHGSSDGGRTFEAVGDVGGAPAALATAGDELVVGLHTTYVNVSRDGGRTWQLRAVA